MVAQRQLTDEQDPRILIVPLMSLARSYFLLGDQVSGNSRFAECETYLEKIKSRCSHFAISFLVRRPKAFMYSNFCDHASASRLANQALEYYRENASCITESDEREIAEIISGLDVLAGNLLNVERHGDAAYTYEEELDLVLSIRMSPPGSSMAHLFNDYGFSTMLASDDEEGDRTIESARAAFQRAINMLFSSDDLNSLEYAIRIFTWV